MRVSLILLGSLLACGTDPADDIRVTVYELGAPTAGATVWVVDPATGKILDEGTTDSSGVFEGAAVEGATVSAALRYEGPDADSFEAYSVMGVHLGDDIALGDQQSRSADELGGVNVTLPGDYPEGWVYEISTGCSQTNEQTPASVLLPVYSSCVTANSELIVTARVLPFGSQAPLAFSTPQVIAAPSPGETVSVQLPAWRTDFASLDVSLAGIPSETSIARSDLLVFYGGVRFDTSQIETSESLAGSATHPHLYIPGPEMRLVWSASIGLGPIDSIEGMQMQLTSASTPPATHTTDFGSSDVLPPIRGAGGVIGANESPAITWQADASSLADGLVANAAWQNPNRGDVRWLLVAPTGGTSLTYPRTPESLRSMRGTVAFPIRASIRVVDADHLTGYDELRSAGDEIVNFAVPTRDLQVRLSASGEGTF